MRERKRERVFPSKVIPQESYALSHPSLLRMHALLEGFFRDPLQFRRHGLFDVVHVFKTGPLDDPLKLGEDKEYRRHVASSPLSCVVTKRNMQTPYL